MKSLTTMIVACALGAVLAGCGSEGDAVAAKPDSSATSPTAPSTAASTAPAAIATAAPKRTYPLTISFSGEPNAAQDRIARTALAASFKEFAEYFEGRPAPYSIDMLDLNDDGRDDMIVHFEDQQFCGTMGCPGYGILATPTGFASKGIHLGTCFNYSITGLPSTTKGMRDLKFDDFPHKHVWSGQKYEGGCAD